MGISEVDVRTMEDLELGSFVVIGDWSMPFRSEELIG